MACYKPLKAFQTHSGVSFRESADAIRQIELPCGRCLGCLEKRAGEWRVRIMHEAALWPENCVIALTYAQENLPADGSLDHRDFQLFMKKLRRRFAGRTIRFYMCGEYGPLNLRPHFHAVLFNIHFSDRVVTGKSGAGAVYYDSPLLAEIWGLGRVSVQDLVPRTAGYVARYVTKKLGQGAADIAPYVTADGVCRRREYGAMSLRPGIGAGWFSKYKDDVYPHDYVVSDGTKLRPPRYYDKLLERADRLESEEVAFRREVKARALAADSTEARLAVREKVHAARVKRFVRDSV